MGRFLSARVLIADDHRLLAHLAAPQNRVSQSQFLPTP